MMMISLLLSGILSLILWNPINMIVVTNAYVPTIKTTRTTTTSSRTTQPKSIITFNQHTTTTNNNYHNNNIVYNTKKATQTIRRMAVDEQIFTTPSIQSTDQSSSSSTSITELPDSLSDAAIRAAEATKSFYDLNNNNGGNNIPIRCRIDFDTSIGDETFTLLKQSTEFMQQYITALSYALLPQLLQQRQQQLINIIQAKNELQSLQTNKKNNSNVDITSKEQREDELIELIANNGRNISDSTTSTTSDSSNTIKKQVIRIYFPDEGSAALARRDWTNTNSIMPVADSIEFKSCNGIQQVQSKNTKVIAQIFFCPRASDADAVERILLQTETDSIQQSSESSQSSQSSSLLTIFVNPILVDMGVTGFGYAGRRLRERLIEPLQYIYYLRTLPWGAITRQWPYSFTIWQEDSNEIGGYKCIANCNNRLPSNPEVIDIYEMVNNNNKSNNNNSGNSGGGGFLDQLGDFVNGMMKL